ncbi:hypothetical protein AFLA_009427 [Aspergillus flavus NRRL3357]|nr:hypothetical protein AFLA_009427 [Aspergillus flavus NRRL3357]
MHGSRTCNILETLGKESETHDWWGAGDLQTVSHVHTSKEFLSIRRFEVDPLFHSDTETAACLNQSSIARTILIAKLDRRLVDWGTSKMNVK